LVSVQLSFTTRNLPFLARLICASTVGYIYSPSELAALLAVTGADRGAACTASTLHCPDFRFEGETTRQTAEREGFEDDLGIAA